MRQILTILILFTFIQTASAYNIFWAHLDKRVIKKTIKLDRQNPKSVEQFFKHRGSDTTKENLGFGWKMWQTAFPGGYISIKATFFYFHDSIVSYTLTPQLPDHEELIEKYKKWYQDSFAYSSTDILPFRFHEKQILRPLTEYMGTLSPQTVPDNLLKYMSPKSGTMYGYTGGYGGNFLQNRKAFIEIKDSLTNDRVVFLMYSINPASRLTAIEYYLKHKDSFSNQPTLNEWAEKNFQELPTVQTLFGCIGQSYDTRALVQMYSTMVDK